MARSTAVFALFLLLAFFKSAHGELLINAGGPGIPCSFIRGNVHTEGYGVRKDTGRWASKHSKSFRQRFPLNLPPRASVFYSHRYAVKGDLVYTLPVPNGKFSVNLYFAENWKGARKGTRQFYVIVNGKRVVRAGPLGLLDVYARVGYGTPLSIIGTRVHVKNKKLVIRLKRVRGKNNPMISGIQVFATTKEQAANKKLNPDALAKREGAVFSKCDDPPFKIIHKPLRGKRRCEAVVDIQERVYNKMSLNIFRPRTIVYRAVLGQKNQRYVGRTKAEYTGMSQEGPKYQVHTYRVKFDIKLNPFVRGGQTLHMYEEDSKEQRVGELLTTRIEASTSRKIEGCKNYCATRYTRSNPTHYIKINCKDADVYSRHASCTWCQGGFCLGYYNICSQKALVYAVTRERQDHLDYSTLESYVAMQAAINFSV